MNGMCKTALFMNIRFDGEIMKLLHIVLQIKHLGMVSTTWINKQSYNGQPLHQWYIDVVTPVFENYLLLMLILLAGRVNLISAHRPLPLSPIASSLQPSHTDYIHPLKIKNKLAELENIEKLDRAGSSKDE